MAIKYRKEILPALKEAGYSAHRMRVEKIMGERTIQQIRNGELVAWSAIDKICCLLKCQPGDLLEYVESTEPDDIHEIPVESIKKDTMPEEKNSNRWDVTEEERNAIYQMIEETSEEERQSLLRQFRTNEGLTDDETMFRIMKSRRELMNTGIKFDSTDDDTLPF